MTRKGEKVLRPVHPNVGIERAYRRAMQTLVAEMAASYRWWLCACWRGKLPILARDMSGFSTSNEDEKSVVSSFPTTKSGEKIDMAQDASPAAELDKVLKRLGRHWDRRFRDAAPRLASYFAKAAHRRSENVLHKILRDAGISVRFKMTPAMQDILSATLAENVGLIRSIPEQYHTQVQGMVMRSVKSGRDLHQLTRDLKRRYDITQERAELIARDQNNKATSAMTRARQTDIGIDEAVWLHSHGGKEPRKTHVANDGKRYKVAEGWYDPDPKVRRKIWPGELIRCRCVSKSVVKGFS